MRHVRPFPATAVVLVTLVLAGCAGAPEVEEPSAAAPTTTTTQTTPTSSAAPATTTEPPGATTGGGPGATEPPAGQPAGATAAEQTAAYFMRTEIGMLQPLTRPFESTGADTGKVAVYPGGAGEGGGPVEGLTSVVSLRRRPGGWEVTGVRSPAIRVTSPAEGDRIASPLRVTGSAHTFEGSVTVRVRDNRDGVDTTLGEGHVTGGGDQRRPFEGTVEFRRAATTTGWVVFSEASALDGPTQVIQATAVRVRLGG